MKDRPGAAVRLFVVDDHPVVREGLRLLLEQQGIVVCGEAGDATTALAAIPAASPDLVLVDLSLGQESGLGLLRAVAGLLPRVPRLVYSMHEDAFHVQQAFAAGASGYVTKREISGLLALAIAEVLAGRRYASPRAEAVLGTVTAEARLAEPLSPRELEVYRLLGEGYSAPGIAAELGVSRRTVDSYFARILEKLHLHGMEALRRRAAVDRDREQLAPDV
ncbi:MAG: response regulator transcription factor [Thermoanaerobaculaceae bacterium]|jgi:DNA-binding NarL/FixJ family response regulator|nr:response regulator transcription factor [Thermoanaerobaculaceae bacterium]